MRYYELFEANNAPDDDDEPPIFKTAGIVRINKGDPRPKRAKPEPPISSMSEEDIINAIEQDIFLFRVHRPSSYPARRQTPGYIREMQLILPIVKVVGIKTGIELYKAVRLYTTTFYGRMNNSLRAGKLPKNANLIDQFISLAPKIKQNTLYRGLSGEFFSTLSVGQTIKDDAFVSTTTDFAIAKHFSSRKTKGGVLEISGVAGVAVKIPEKQSNDTQDEFESEYLLPRGCTFKVMSIADGLAKMKLISKG